MNALEVLNLTKTYKSGSRLRRGAHADSSRADFTLSLSFSVSRGEVLSVIGPSGAGKSTLLSVISGQELPDSGRILLDGRDITRAKMQSRNIGMIFQDFSLFPSMNVEKNICYGMKKRDGQERHALCAALLEEVGLSGYEKRSVTTLSGGEAQRVALARALAAEPSVLLLDEPLSALDVPLRRRLRRAIRGVHDARGTTMLYVTHDRDEAFAVSDRILIMNEGKIDAEGTPGELYSKPPTLFSALFTGDGTALPAEDIAGCGDLAAGSTLFFRPSSVIVSEHAEEAAPLPGYIALNGARVVSADFNGDAFALELRWRGRTVLARAPSRPSSALVSLMIRRDDVRVFL